MMYHSKLFFSPTETFLDKMVGSRFMQLDLRAVPNDLHVELALTLEKLTDPVD